MKQIYTILVAVVFSLSQIQSLSAIYHEEPDVELLDFVNVRDLTSDTLEEIMTGQKPSLAIEFSEGDLFPLELFLDGDLVSLVKPESTNLGIQFHKTVLLRNKEGKLLFSTDLRGWRPFRGFAKGKLQAGINVNEENGPEISFGLELNEKGHHYHD